MREGNLQAPTRHPIAWKSPEYYDEPAAFKELERIFDICHGCRRCVGLCGAFPTLFDLVDEGKTGEVDGVVLASGLPEQVRNDALPVWNCPEEFGRL